MLNYLRLRLSRHCRDNHKDAQTLLRQRRNKSVVKIRRHVVRVCGRRWQYELRLYQLMVPADDERKGNRMIESYRDNVTTV